MKSIWLTLFALSLPGSLSAKAALTLDGASTDSTITINYVVPESSHVQVKVIHVGVHAVLQYGYQAPGNHAAVLDKSGLPTGSYTVSLILDRDRKKVTRRGFLHSASGMPVTSTRDERDHWNRSFAVTSFNPKEGVELWNEFLNRYPSNASRGKAFLYSMMARIPASDSVDVHAAADSAAALLPHSGTYDQIGRFLSGLDGFSEGKYPQTALFFADRAVSHVTDVPEPYRNEALFRYHCLRGRCLQLLGRFESSEQAYIKAINILDSLADSGTFSDFGRRVWAYQGLASLYEQQGRHGDAIGFYEKAVKSNPRNPELWMALQRNFNLAHGSDTGYEAFSRRLEASVRSDEHEKKHGLLGKPLPEFELPRLDGGTLSLNQIKGNVSVLNFWAFWCGPCMYELPVIARLARESSGRGVKVVAIHTPREFSPGITREEFPEIVRNGVREHEGSFETVWDSKKQNFAVRSGITSLPVTLVADREGIVRYRMTGFDPKNAYRKLNAVVDSLIVASADPR